MELMAIVIAIVLSLCLGLTASRVALWAVFFFMSPPDNRYNPVVAASAEGATPVA
jgi:hypothetical protein